MPSIVQLPACVIKGRDLLMSVYFEFLNKRLFVSLQSCSFTCTVVVLPVQSVLLGKRTGQENSVDLRCVLHTFYQCRHQYVVQAANKWCGKSSGVEYIGKD